MQMIMNFENSNVQGEILDPGKWMQGSSPSGTRSVTPSVLFIKKCNPVSNRNSFVYQSLIMRFLVKQTFIYLFIYSFNHSVCLSKPILNILVCSLPYNSEYA